MNYGVDVAVRRADDLDALMLADIAARVACGDHPTALDLGCGALGQSRRLAERGAAVTAVDIIDQHLACTAAQTQLAEGASGGSIQCVTADLTDWLRRDNASSTFDIVSIQRTLHYLPYDVAVEVLQRLRVAPEGRLYLSVTGATSAIAAGYPALTLPLAQRFALLQPSYQETFSITAPVCIYTELEVQTLLRDTGWEITWLRVSDFGNIKAVARRVTV